MKPGGLVIATMVLAGCGGEGLLGESLVVESLDWNPGAVATGEVSAVVESGPRVLVLGGRGALILADGMVIATDETITDWRSAAAIPAPDGSGEWLVGVSGAGTVFRLAEGGPARPIGDRYGVDRDHVRAVVSLGQGLVGFAQADAIAIADGANVERHPGTFLAPAGGGGRVAAVVGEQVRVLDPVAATERRYDLPGAVAAAFDCKGRLAAVTSDALYLERHPGVLEHAWESQAPIDALASSGCRLWIAAGGRLHGGRDGEVSAATSNPTPDAATLASGCRLLGSPTGDVWTLCDGHLNRITVVENSDESRWERTVRPVQVRVCAACHGASDVSRGAAMLDLSTYQGWADRRARIAMVIDGPTPRMPPSGSGYVLTAEEKTAILEWANR